MVIFAEHPTLRSVSGALSIAAGVLIVTTGGQRTRAKLGPGVASGLATGVAIAVYTPWDGWAVKRAAVPPLVFDWGGEVVRVLLLSPFALRAPAGIAALARAQAPRVFGIALLSPPSYIRILLALLQGAVGHIAPAREVSILIGTWLGGHVLGEGDRTRRLVAAAAFAGGVVALAFA